MDYRRSGSDMRILVISGLILMILAFNSLAAVPMQLGGDAGKAILVKVANSTFNQTINGTQNLDTTTNRRSNVSAGDLWDWGTPPAGYAVDKSGNLVRISYDEEWLPGI
jgi:hypothetical protein